MLSGSILLPPAAILQSDYPDRLMQEVYYRKAQAAKPHSSAACYAVRSACLGKIIAAGLQS